MHATEDEQGPKAIEEILLVPSTRFLRSSSRGHYKNKIVLQKAILSSKESAMLAKRVISLLNSADREHLFRLVNDYADEKVTYTSDLTSRGYVKEGFAIKKMTL